MCIHFIQLTKGGGILTRHLKVVGLTLLQDVSVKTSEYRDSLPGFGLTNSNWCLFAEPRRLDVMLLLYVSASVSYGSSSTVDNGANSSTIADDCLLRDLRSASVASSPPTPLVCCANSASATSVANQTSKNSRCCRRRCRRHRPSS